MKCLIFFCLSLSFLLILVIFYWQINLMMVVKLQISLIHTEFKKKYIFNLNHEDDINKKKDLRHPVLQSVSSYRKYLKIMQPSQNRCTRLQYRLAVISEAPSIRRHPVYIYVEWYWGWGNLASKLS